MPRFVDPQKRDPFRTFNFRISLGQGVTVAACRKISGLTGSVDVVKFRAGDNPHSTDELSPGRAHYEAVTLEAGLTNDKAFEDWATLLIRNERSVAPRAIEPNYRREITITLMDLDNQTPVKKFILHNAWCSKYTAMSELAAEANDVAIETLEIQHEGFLRLDVV
ncbi:MAG TPA: phage tail protein [Myxococcaceae bacterium]|nr:phage tail protein [Myxococcaceae bacterium]